MKRYAIVHEGVVENVILWDGETEWSPGNGRVLVAVDDNPTVEAGQNYDAKTGGFTESTREREPTEDAKSVVDALLEADSFESFKEAMSTARDSRDLLAEERTA